MGHPSIMESTGGRVLSMSSNLSDTSTSATMMGMMTNWTDGFETYDVDTVETPLAFLVFSAVYLVLALCWISPLASLLSASATAAAAAAKSGNLQQQQQKLQRQKEQGGGGKEALTAPEDEEEESVTQNNTMGEGDTMTKGTATLTASPAPAAASLSSLPLRGYITVDDKTSLKDLQPPPSAEFAPTHFVVEQEMVRIHTNSPPTTAATTAAGEASMPDPTTGSGSSSHQQLEQEQGQPSLLDGPPRSINGSLPQHEFLAQQQHRSDFTIHPNRSEKRTKQGGSSVPSVASTSKLNQKSTGRPESRSTTRTASSSISCPLQNQEVPPDSDHLLSLQQTQSTDLLGVQSLHSNNNSYRSAPGGSRRLSLGSMRAWKSRQRPIGRIEAMQRSLAAERQSHASEEGSHASRRSKLSYASRSISRVPSHQSRGISDLASNVLDEENVQGEAEFYRRKYVQRSRSRRLLQQPSIAGSDVISALPALDPDAVSPGDAADAHDIGRANMYDELDDDNAMQITDCWDSSGNPVILCCGRILELCEPDYETKRIWTLAISPTVSAMIDPFFRFGMVAIISHFISNNAMSAYVLTVLFIRLTLEELSGAISDAQSNVLQDALALGGNEGFRRAGKHVQLAILLQMLICIPVLLLWVYYMEDLIFWLVDSQRIAKLASDYTKIIVIDYGLQTCCRAFMLPFHLLDQAQFENGVDICATVLTLVAIGSVAGVSDLPSLVTLGWIQVIVGAAKCVVKLSVVFLTGRIQPFRSGLLAVPTLVDLKSLGLFLTSAIPLFIGSAIELKEWELLTLFIRHLGGAEVVSWAIMGIIWEAFEASTEGLGEASGVRISFYLVENLPVAAKRLADRAALVAFCSALVTTSIFFMASPNILTTLTTDWTIQHLLEQLVGMTGLANVAMSFAQMYWSVVGAQGRFAVASSTILLSRWIITIPLCCMSIFGYGYDLQSVAASISIGYATAAAGLSYVVAQSDWNELARSAQEFDNPREGEEGMPLDFEMEEYEGKVGGYEEDEGGEEEEKEEESEGDDEEEEDDEDDDDDDSDGDGSSDIHF